MCWKLLHLVQPFLLAALESCWLGTQFVVFCYWSNCAVLPWSLWQCCLSLPLLLPTQCSLTASIRQAIVIALSIVSSGSVCSLSDRFESHKSTIIQYRIVSLCTMYIVAMFCQPVKLAMLWMNIQVLLLPVYAYLTSSFVDRVSSLNKMSLWLVWYCVVLLSVIVAQSKWIKDAVGLFSHWINQRVGLGFFTFRSEVWCLTESLESEMPPFATAQAVRNQTSCELLKIDI